MSGNIVDQKEISKAIDRTNECMRLLMKSGLSEEDKQRVIDDPDSRDEIVEFWKSLVFPVITVTKDKDLCFPDWPHKVKKNTVEPTGVMKLDFVSLLPVEQVSFEKMINRAEQENANLGLCHAQAFLKKHETKSFGLPSKNKNVGTTTILFPGTIVGRWENNRKHIPLLRWVRGRWILVWEYLGSIHSGAYLIRPTLKQKSLDSGSSLFRFMKDS